MSGKSTGLVVYNEAVRALAECVRVDEAKNLQDKAAAAQEYARQANDPRMLAYATEIRMRAQRRVGEILIDMARTGARRDPKNSASQRAAARGRWNKNAATSGAVDAPPTIKELGLERNKVAAWQKLAKMSPKEFEEQVAVAAGRKPKSKRTATPTRMKSVADAVKKADASNEPIPLRREDPENFKTAFLLRVEQSLHYSRESKQLIARMIEHAKDKSKIRSYIAEHARAVVAAWSQLAQSVEGVPNGEKDSKRA